LVCDRCGFVASGQIEPTDPESAHLEASKSHQCSPARYHWDHWRREAFEQGMDADAADVGRALIREAHQHAWPDHVDMEAMMVRGLREPAEARERWQHILNDRAEAELAGIS
jgi:hypothetical protein